MNELAYGMSQRKKKIIVVGAGVLGLWQALSCARAGFQVCLIDQNAEAEVENASVLAGGMLAPDCEAEAAPELVRDFGREGIKAWRALYPNILERGTLVVASGRDQGELLRYSKMTHGFELVDEARISVLEPDLSGRFTSGLFFGGEAHVVVSDALNFLLEEVKRLGVEVRLGETFSFRDGVRDYDDSVILDCRGMAACDDPLPGLEETMSLLRGVRGERVVIKTQDVQLSRPVRLLHPRHPIYVVPWGNGCFVVGATVIESADESLASVRSVLELLGATFALLPAFGEARVQDIRAGVRPAYPDNIPRAVVAPGGRYISVNGAYRHGFLLAPVLAEAVSGYLTTASFKHSLLVGPDYISGIGAS